MTAAAPAPYSFRDDPAVPDFPDDRVLLVVDGDCALCSWGARTVARGDPDDLFRITTVQSDLGGALLAHYGIDAGDPWTWLVVEDGIAKTSSDGVIAVGRRLAGFWGVLARIAGVFPKFLREPVYRFVARHRIRVFGPGDVCALPDPALRRRLID
ncbi:DUF393 domain-containing protein [Marinicauda salina]|uniref:DUF393 domain-containing protein n=1 Tax=Marinicauda salina TaxID=2135793 RepID=A0A2U2BU47_9PROT|nr:DCC1-like thiol-disulfide oxidoreductase family protein [Marinicauda salina]PWE17517.1 DUF393 domain-containing protein [Marinicauda salina]